jgi:DNA-binding NtrC family response regulator
MKKPMLQNARVLVLEDDYYLATDLQAALEAAGANVIGPFANTADAAAALASDRPDCALVDLNLGRGINFELPQQLARRSVPFAFVTGYDRAAIPEEFASTIRVEKPIALQKVAQVTETLLSAQRR